MLDLEGIMGSAGCSSPETVFNRSGGLTMATVERSRDWKDAAPNRDLWHIIVDLFE